MLRDIDQKQNSSEMTGDFDPLSYSPPTPPPACGLHHSVQAFGFQCQPRKQPLWDQPGQQQQQKMSIVDCNVPKCHLKLHSL